MLSNMQGTFRRIGSASRGFSGNATDGAQQYLNNLTMDLSPFPASPSQLCPPLHRPHTIPPHDLFFPVFFFQSIMMV